MVDFGIGEIGLAMTLMGGATAAGGSIFGGEASSSMYKYKAALAEQNAKIAKQNAAYELALGESQAQQQGMKTRATVSQTRATQGAGGLDVNTGSNAAVRTSELQLGQFDQAILRNNAARRAYGWEVQAVQETAESQLDTMAASNAKTEGMLGAFTSILGAGGSFSSKWMQGRGAGIW